MYLSRFTRNVLTHLAESKAFRGLGSAVLQTRIRHWNRQRIVAELDSDAIGHALNRMISLTNTVRARPL